MYIRRRFSNKSINSFAILSYQFLTAKYNGVIVPIAEVEIRNVKAYRYRRTIDISKEDIKVINGSNTIQFFVNPKRLLGMSSGRFRLSFQYRLKGDDEFTTFVDVLSYEPIEIEVKRRNRKGVKK